MHIHNWKVTYTHMGTGEYVALRCRKCPATGTARVNLNISESECIDSALREMRQGQTSSPQRSVRQMSTELLKTPS